MSLLQDEEVVEFRIAFSLNNVTKKEIIEQTNMSDKAVRNMLYGDSYKSLGCFCKSKVGRPSKK